jgi:hypothetical protein
VPCVNLSKWGQAMARFDVQIADDHVDEVRVSTVFLGMDHNSDHDGPPLLFETMIVGGLLDQFRMRCTTYEEAEVMHQIVLAMVKREQENNDQAMEIAENLIDIIRHRKDD